jgi:transcriptional regulator with XRE-family HTH domain
MKAGRGQDRSDDVSPEQAFGEVIRTLRKRKGLSQERLSFEAALDRSYVGHVERATKSPTLRTIYKLAAALGVRATDLISRTERLRTKARLGGSSLNRDR